VQSKSSLHLLTVKQLRRFLGLAGWYRRFVDDYAPIAVPLTDLLKKNKVLSWTQAAEDAFNHLKTKLVPSSILRTPNFKKPFILLCDASLYGLGCVLSQENDGGVELTIAYMSEKLSKAQRNHSVTELEC